jgi:hypothetical protein
VDVGLWTLDTYLDFGHWTLDPFNQEEHTFV